MPTIKDMLDVAHLQQTFGDLRPGFLEHENFKGPIKPLAVEVEDRPCDGPSRTVEMVEEVEKTTGERRVRPL
jgi:hypothetical protein